MANMWAGFSPQALDLGLPAQGASPIATVSKPKAPSKPATPSTSKSKADTEVPELAKPAGPGGLTLQGIKDIMEKLTALQQASGQLAQMMQDPSMQAVANSVAPMMQMALKMGSAQVSAELMGKLIGENNMETFQDAISGTLGPNNNQTYTQESKPGQPYSGHFVDPIGTAMNMARQNQQVQARLAALAPMIQQKFMGMNTLHPQAGPAGYVNPYAGMFQNTAGGGMQFSPAYSQLNSAQQAALLQGASQYQPPTQDQYNSQLKQVDADAAKFKNDYFQDASGNWKPKLSSI